MKLKIKTFLALFISIIYFSSCSAPKQSGLFTAVNDIVTDTIKSVYVVNNQGESELYYRIKPTDVIAIRDIQDLTFGSKTTQNSGSSGVFSSTVDTEGFLKLPGEQMGKVKLAELTRKEAALKVQEVYSKTLLKNSIIELSIINLKVTLLGEFQKQGNFLLAKDNTTLIDIIGDAGGITSQADPKTLKIIRGDRAKPEIIFVNLSNINSLASNKLILQNGDIILLQPRKINELNNKVQSMNLILQPLLVLINLAIIIITVTK